MRAVTSAGTKDFLFDPNGRAFTVINNGSWAQGEITSPIGYLATYANSTTYFTHTHWLGTVRARSNVSGALVEGLSSLPFGDSQTTSGVSPVQFTGLDFDSESNLTHAWFRQHSATQGRWTSPDPAGVGVVDPGSPQSWNRYSYVINNPLRYTDALGTQEVGGSLAVSAGYTFRSDRCLQLDQGRIGSNAMGSPQLWFHGRAHRDSDSHAAKMGELRW